MTHIGPVHAPTSHFLEIRLNIFPHWKNFIGEIIVALCRVTNLFDKVNFKNVVL